MASIYKRGKWFWVSLWVNGQHGVVSKNSIASEGAAASAQNGGRSRFARGARRLLRARLSGDREFPPHASYAAW
jgi:hypothetical protein